MLVGSQSFFPCLFVNLHQPEMKFFLKEGEKDPFGMAQKYAVSFYCQNFIQNFVRMRSELHFFSRTFPVCFKKYFKLVPILSE